MPNHVTSRCVITGPADEVARFRERMIVTKLEEREPHWAADRQPQWFTTFDFGQIIPMPASIEASEASTAAEEGAVLIALRGDRGAPFATGGLYSNRIDWIRAEAGLDPRAHIADVAAAFLEKHPKWEAAGRTRLQALIDTGHTDWYSWSIAHWGTKWGAYDFAVEGEVPLTIKFDTAWSFPTPVFTALAAEFPTLTFDVVCFDEGWNFAGVGAFGVVSTYAEVKATDELYERVYGRKPESDEDEAVAAPFAEAGQ